MPAACTSSQSCGLRAWYETRFGSFWAVAETFAKKNRSLRLLSKNQHKINNLSCCLPYGHGTQSHPNKTVYPQDVASRSHENCKAKIKKNALPLAPLCSVPDPAEQQAPNKKKKHMILLWISRLSPGVIFLHHRIPAMEWLLVENEVRMKMSWVITKQISRPYVSHQSIVSLHWLRRTLTAKNVPNQICARIAPMTVVLNKSSQGPRFANLSRFQRESRMRIRNQIYGIKQIRLQTIQLQ